MANKVKEHIGFHYLLTEMQPCTFMFFGIEYIPQDLLNKIKKNESLITYLEYNLMILLCVNFIVSL